MLLGLGSIPRWVHLKHTFQSMPCLCKLQVTCLSDVCANVTNDTLRFHHVVTSMQPPQQCILRSTVGVDHCALVHSC
jgi:hypothetical protein